MKRIFTCFLTGLLLAGCTHRHNVAELNKYSREQLHQWNKKLTQVVVKDIFTPPVASRIYVYPNIAAYEVLRQGNPQYQSLAGQLRGLDGLPEIANDSTQYLPVAAIIAFSTVAQQLVFAKEDIAAYETVYLKQIDQIGIDPEILEKSITYGRAVGNAVLAWAKQDGYAQRTALPRYILENVPGKWQPTAPGYMPAIEPHWNTIRPLLLDSCSQFQPPLPTVFDSIPASQFYKEGYEVYQTVRNLSPEQLEIAKFWDCNPNISYTKGHVTFFNQKISPGGHWLSIASIAGKNQNLNLLQTSEVFTHVSIALFDGFISCWDTKFKTALVRPETYIEKYIDPDWDPILQTPPFPEYTSGHSVISGAASTVLTQLLGDNVAYTDSTEVEYGLPARKFRSFHQAADEAAISRLYGGIHYRPAIENGIRQGRALGQYVVNRLQTRAVAQVNE